MTDTPNIPTQRAKRAVESTEFDAFARRILRAYGRRVAAGDVEALTSLAQLSTDLDAVTRQAVAGLRQASPPYSWAEIAARLGVSRQAAQMRYGQSADRGRLDQRLIDAGQHVTPIQFADLTNETTARTNRVAARQAARPAPSPDRTADLFDLIAGEDSKV